MKMSNRLPTLPQTPEAKKRHDDKLSEIDAYLAAIDEQLDDRGPESDPLYGP